MSKCTAEQILDRTRNSITVHAHSPRHISHHGSSVTGEQCAVFQHKRLVALCQIHGRFRAKIMLTDLRYRCGDVHDRKVQTIIVTDTGHTLLNISHSNLGVIGIAVFVLCQPSIPLLVRPYPPHDLSLAGDGQGVGWQQNGVAVLVLGRHLSAVGRHLPCDAAAAALVALRAAGALGGAGGANGRFYCPRRAAQTQRHDQCKQYAYDSLHAHSPSLYKILEWCFRCYSNENGPWAIFYTISL